MIAPSDDLDPPLLAVHSSKSSLACTVDDNNIQAQSDADGSSFDPRTNMAVIGAWGGNSALVLNLKGSSFSGSSGDCTLEEGGTSPNSVLIDLGNHLPGAAVDPSRIRRS